MQLRHMTPEVDTHTHTILSGHAWSTLTENCLAAKAKGMKGLCLTEHGPAIENGAPGFLPHTQRLLPELVEGIRVYRGIEANILDHENHLDIPDAYLPFCEFAIASIHGHMFPEKADSEANTATYLAMLRHPNIDMIGHADDPAVPCDLEQLVLAAGENGKILELNNNSANDSHRPGSLGNLRRYIQYCKKHDQRVCVSSDAHFHTMIGSVSPMMTLLDEMAFPPELIVNLTQERFERYLAEKRTRLQSID